MNYAYKLNNINKSYNGLKVLDNLNLEIKQGELVAVVGKSGIGKTTLLNIMGLLEKIDSGKLEILDYNISNLSLKKREKFFRYDISYLFQNFALIDNETIGENLDIALMYSKLDKNEKNQAKINALKEVGLNMPLNKKIYKLSGGEQQRVALARVLLKPSKIILADEPTGSLDTITRDSIIDIIKKINKLGKTIIIVTHDKNVAKECTRIIYL